MRLDKLLSNTGVGSRSQVKTLVKKGQVTVNGAVVKSSDCDVDENSDVIKVSGKEIFYRTNSYYMLNKPAGVVTATEDKHDKTVLDLVPADLRKNLFPVGRLDKDTEGLLLLTDNGPLAHALLSPKKHVDKTYLVQCKLPVNQNQKNALEEGLDIGEDKNTLPAEVELTDSDDIILLTIREGKFHQVKRMLQAVGNEVVYLKRLRMGSLSLDENLALGEFRPLTEEEETELLKALK